MRTLSFSFFSFFSFLCFFSFLRRSSSLEEELSLLSLSLSLSLGIEKSSTMARAGARVLHATF